MPTKLSLQTATEWILAVAALVLCWFGVSWALMPGQYLWLDEIEMQTLFLHGLDWHKVTILPQAIYNDRPIGFILARILYDTFGFDYQRTVQWLLLIHTANLLLGYLLFRRLGVSRIIGLAAIACYGSLSTTAQTATYMGEIFDVGCLFFILGSTLLFLMESKAAMFGSALLFFFALRTKELAIVLPVPLAILALKGWPVTLASIKAAVGRMWPHIVIAAAVGGQYALFIPRMSTDLAVGNPYHMSLSPGPILDAYIYYLRLIFGTEEIASSYPTVLIAIGALLLVAVTVLTRNFTLLFAIVGFTLTLLPVAVLSGQRAIFYTYVPQTFLLLAFALVAEELIGRVPPKGRFVVGLCIALAVMGWTASFRLSNYFKDRIHFMQNVRTISTRTGTEALKIPARTGKTVIEVHSGTEIPWVFVAGPCGFFQIVWRTLDVTCAMNPPPAESHEQGDQGRIVVNYHADGSIDVR